MEKANLKTDEPSLVFTATAPVSWAAAGGARAGVTSSTPTSATAQRVAMRFITTGHPPAPARPNGDARWPVLRHEDPVQGLAQVGDEVGGIFDADRDTDEAGVDLEGRPDDRGMGHAVGVFDQRLHPAEGLGQREDP